MLSGRFGSRSGRPYLLARLLIPRLGVRGDLSFLLDTGADHTLLLPSGGRAQGLDYSRLGKFDTRTRGAGGPIRTHKESAWLVFSDGTTLFGYSITLSILEERNDMDQVPSLIGRDILHHFRMRYAYSTATIELDVEYADAMITASRGLGAPIVRHE